MKDRTEIQKSKCAIFYLLYALNSPTMASTFITNMAVAADQRPHCVSILTCETCKVMYLIGNANRKKFKPDRLIQPLLIGHMFVK